MNRFEIIIISETIKIGFLLGIFSYHIEEIIYLIKDLLICLILTLFSINVRDKEFSFLFKNKDPTDFIKRETTFSHFGLKKKPWTVTQFKLLRSEILKSLN